MIKSIIAISLGASCGAVFRWFLGTKLNSLTPQIPLGTLSANLIGGFLIGFFVAFFANNSTLSPEWKLLIITGFLGGLTTFSTFSAEMFALIQQNNFNALLFGLVLHVGGSLIMTALGLLTYKIIGNL